MRVEAAVAVGSYLLAAGGGVLIGKPVAITLVIVGSLFLLLGIAGTRTAQRQLPWLASMPLGARPATRKAPTPQQVTIDSAPLPPQVVNRRIWADDYGPMVHQRIFERCEITGLVHFPGSHITQSKWLLGSFEVVRDPTTDLPPGTVSFVNCIFLECEFQDCTAFGTYHQIVSLRAVFGLSTDPSTEVR